MIALYLLRNAKNHMKQKNNNNYIKYSNKNYKNLLSKCNNSNKAVLKKIIKMKK